MKRVDLEVAVAAGLAVVLPLYKILTLPGTCDSPNPLTLGKAGVLLAIREGVACPMRLDAPVRRRRLLLQDDY